MENFIACFPLPQLMWGRCFHATRSQFLFELDADLIASVKSSDHLGFNVDGGLRRLRSPIPGEWLLLELCAQDARFPFIRANPHRFHNDPRFADFEAGYRSSYNTRDGRKRLFPWERNTPDKG